MIDYVGKFWIFWNFSNLVSYFVKKNWNCCIIVLCYFIFYDFLLCRFKLFVGVCSCIVYRNFLRNKIMLFVDCVVWGWNGFVSYKCYFDSIG